MIDFVKELDAILESDPLGLLDVKPKALAITADQRLVSTFEEISAFILEYGHEPTQSRDIKERQLYSRLKGLRESPEKVAALVDFDSYNLLGDVKIIEPKEISTIDDVLGDDVLGLLGDDADEIFTLKNVPKTINVPDKFARREPCKDFDRFEHLFTQCHSDLVSGIKELKKFTGEQQITAGHFFILHGVMVYVSEVGEKVKKGGKINAKLHCIFENGTESNMLLRSLATELYKDEGGRRVLNPDDLFSEAEKVTEEDEATGYVYVLSSLSDDPQIKEIKNLFKIGFSSQPVKQRIQNAKQEPTYLMADVSVVTEFKCFNMNPQKLELLLHTFFAKSCLNMDVFDSDGKRHTPREWFIVPIGVIETAVQLLINGEIINYRYDNTIAQIVDK